MVVRDVLSCRPCETCSAFVKEAAPGLRRRLSTSGHVAGDGALRDVEPELEQLTVDSRSTPERIRGGHLPDQRPQLWINPRPARPWARLASPVAPESFPVPANDGCRLNEDESTSPAAPKPPQPGPDKAICEAEARAPVRGRQNGSRWIATAKARGDAGGRTGT